MESHLLEWGQAPPWGSPGSPHSGHRVREAGFANSGMLCCSWPGLCVWEQPAWLTSETLGSLVPVPACYPNLVLLVTQGVLLLLLFGCHPGTSLSDTQPAF
jgi:hypothetical protein